MKKSIAEEMEKEIKERKKLPAEVKDKMNTQVFRNLLFAIFIIIYFVFLNLGFYNIDKTIFIQDTAVFSMATLILAIILFEKAYRKGKGFLAIHGLEVLAVALLTLFMPYTYFYLEPVVSKIIMMVPLAFAIYYVAKSAIICAKIQTQQDAKVSDVKDIVKKETRILDETIEMDKDKEAELEEKEVKVSKIKQENPKKEKSKTKEKDKSEKIAKKEVKKTTKKTTTKKKEESDKKVETKKAGAEKTATKKTTKPKKKEEVTNPEAKTGETKKKTTRTKKEVAEPTTKTTKTRRTTKATPKEEG